MYNACSVGLGWLVFNDTFSTNRPSLYRALSAQEINPITRLLYKQMTEPVFEPRSFCSPSRYRNYSATEADMLAVKCAQTLSVSANTNIVNRL